MDGYSVEEAAQVLGIPESRVWELIARGVLSGASEGRADMRVFLRPPAASDGPSFAADDGAQRSNGGDAPVAFEASPFRELLTEFRNLTERYGQALLALGEARGEVASLRSRVDLLEARMDMRLPLRAASTVAWELPDRYAAAPDPPASEAAAQPAETPTPPAPEAPVEPLAAAPDVPSAEPESIPQAEPSGGEAPEITVVVHADEVPDEAPAEPHRRRVSGGRAAVAGLAEALARAEDPTLADLPGAREAGEALAAFQREAETAPPQAEASDAADVVRDEDADEAEAEPEAMPAAFAPSIEAVEEAVAPVEPEALPPARAADEPESAQPEPEPHAAEPEPEPQAAESAEPAEPEQPPSPYTTEVVEPDWFADGDFTWLDAPQDKGTRIPEVGIDDEPAPEPAAEPAVEPAVEPAPEPAAQPQVAIEVAADGDAQDGPPETGAPPHDEVAQEPDSASDELDHVRGEEEAPAVEALQDAFDAPAQPDFAEPPAEPEAPTEPEAIQDAFDEPDATHADAGGAGSPPDTGPTRTQDRRPITGDEAVGFNLFRERPIAVAAPPDPADSAEESNEEALLWFGDEFEVAELEVAGAGWRDLERAAAPVDAAPPPPDAPTAEAAPAEPMPEPAPPEDTDDSEDIDRLAANEGWSPDEVDVLRAYLVRGESVDVRVAAASAEPASPPTGAVPIDQDWLRGRRGPAATAYRRLRRLFQG